MTGTYARYLAGWAIVTALLAWALTALVPGVAGAAGPAAAISGVLVTAALDLAVFALVLRAVGADAARGQRLWGLSLLLKVGVLGSAIALVSARDWFPVDGFVRVLIVSFVVFTHHEVVWLVTRNRGGAARPAVAPGATRC